MKKSRGLPGLHELAASSGEWAVEADWGESWVSWLVGCWWFEAETPLLGGGDATAVWERTSWGMGAGLFGSFLYQEDWETNRRWEGQPASVLTEGKWAAAELRRMIWWRGAGFGRWQWGGGDQPWLCWWVEASGFGWKTRGRRREGKSLSFFYKGSLGRAKREGSWHWGMGLSRLSVFLAKGRDRSWRLRGEDS